MVDKKVKDILRKHSARIEEQIKTTDIQRRGFSQEYIRFKQEMVPELQRYERWCRSLGNVIKLKVAKKMRRRLEGNLKLHMLKLNLGKH